MLVTYINEILFKYLATASIKSKYCKVDKDFTFWKMLAYGLFTHIVRCTYANIFLLRNFCTYSTMVIQIFFVSLQFYVPHIFAFFIYIIVNDEAISVTKTVPIWALKNKMGFNCFISLALIDSILDDFLNQNM